MRLTAQMDNRRTGFQGEGTALAALREQFRFRPPGYFWSPRYQNGSWDGYITLFRYGKVPTGLFLDCQAQLEQKGFKFQVEDRRTAIPFRAIPSKLAARLRPYQIQCIDAMVENSRTGGLIINCTASGKTFIAGAYFARLQGAGLFINDELTLLEQSRRAFVDLLGEREVGEIGHGVFLPKRITVATIQTLHRHRRNPKFESWFQNLQTVIIDELHLALNRQNLDVLERIKPPAVFGLTATLELEKPHVRMRAVALAGPPIYRYPLMQGVEEGVISPGVFVQVLFPQHSVSSNYQAEYHTLISHSSSRNRCIEALVREGLRRGRRVIVLVERLAHLQILSRRLKNLPHRIICGAYSKEFRFEAKTDMDRGKLPLILASRVFAKGIDIRTVDTIIDATGSRSKNSVVQRYGRGTRMGKGKAGLLYLDIGDCSYRGERNRFAACSRSRFAALKQLGVSALRMRWEGDAQEIYNLALKAMPKQSSSIIH